MSQPGIFFTGNWHGNNAYFGFHSDLHVDPDDHDIGADCNTADLEKVLEIIRPDFVQTDAKGHPGYSSWLSKVPGASVAPGIVKEPLVIWRAVSKEMGLPLHCAYSGIFDRAAGAVHPDWCILNQDGHPISTPGWYGPIGTGDRMCPRSPYVDEIMIPQLLELIDHYNVDGFWIDGDLWAVETCYCERCKQAFEEKTGIVDPPKDSSDPNWSVWWNFNRESYEDYAAHYCRAVHDHKSGILIASNWVQGFRNPGRPAVPTDWISGDALAIGKDAFAGVDSLRLDARFISTRGKPWDIMLWSFYGEFHDTSTMKPIEMLQQQAAGILALGGNIQTCENPFIGLRTGKYPGWRARHLAGLRGFVKTRQALCQDTQTLPQIGVLHSEHHFRKAQKCRDFFFSVDVAAARGAALSLIECQFGVDILDEWALLQHLVEFPIVVVPEQDNMSEEMVGALKDYAAGGGTLLISGARGFDRFGPEFLGTNPGNLVDEKIFYLPVKSESVPVKSARWRLVETTTAQSLASLAESPLLDAQLLSNPAAIVNPVGRGRVAYVPFDIFREFDRTHYPLVREFIHEVIRSLGGPLDISVEAPVYVDVILRQRKNRKIIHLINQADGQKGEIPKVGPIFISAKIPQPVGNISLKFEDATLDWKITGQGTLEILINRLHIHSAVVIDLVKSEFQG